MTTVTGAYETLVAIPVSIFCLTLLAALWVHKQLFFTQKASATIFSGCPFWVLTDVSSVLMVQGYATKLRRGCSDGCSSQTNPLRSVVSASSSQWSRAFAASRSLQGWGFWVILFTPGTVWQTRSDNLAIVICAVSFSNKCYLFSVLDSQQALHEWF